MTDVMTDPLPQIVDRLVRRFDPERIVLFGSRARGDARPDSDIDLLVVLSSFESARKTRISMLSELRDLKVSVDVMVTTPADLERRASIPSIPLHTVVQEGREVYARA